MWRKVCQRGRGSCRKHVGGSGVLDVQSVLTVRRFHRVIRRSAAQASTSAIANPDPTGRGCGAQPGETSQPFPVSAVHKTTGAAAAAHCGSGRWTPARRKPPSASTVEAGSRRPSRAARAPCREHACGVRSRGSGATGLFATSGVVLFRGAPELAGGDVRRVAHQPVDPYLVGNQVAAVPVAAVLELVVREGHRVGVGEVPG